MTSVSTSGCPALRRRSQRHVLTVGCFRRRSRRRQGVARALVHGAVRVARERRPFIEAFPHCPSGVVADAHLWTGPAGLFRREGFAVVHDFAPLPRPSAFRSRDTASRSRVALYRVATLVAALLGRCKLERSEPAPAASGGPVRHVPSHFPPRRSRFVFPTIPRRCSVWACRAVVASAPVAPRRARRRPRTLVSSHRGTGRTSSPSPPIRTRRRAIWPDRSRRRGPPRPLPWIESRCRRDGASDNGRVLAFAESAEARGRRLWFEKGLTFAHPGPCPPPGRRRGWPRATP